MRGKREEEPPSEADVDREQPGKPGRDGPFVRITLKEETVREDQRRRLNRRYGNGEFIIKGGPWTKVTKIKE